LSLADIWHGQTIICESVVQGIWPVRVGAGIVYGYGRRGARIIRELGIAEECEGLACEVEVWGAEAADSGEGNSGKSVESDDIAINFVRVGLSDVCDAAMTDVKR
jgi:hypothetical protein